MTSVAEFYSDTPIADLKQVIGDDLHYHFGFFHTPSDPFEEALRNAVRNFYRWIPEGASVLDLGAGWGGPASLLRKERQVRAFCLTNSPQQFDYLGSLGLPAAQADLESGVQGVPEQVWDVVLMMESLEHIREKKALLSQLAGISDTLILRVNCSASYSEGGTRPSYGGTMVMPRPEELLMLLGQAGWKVIFYANRRQSSFPTIASWHQRLMSRYQGVVESMPGHMQALWRLCLEAERNPGAWVSQNPLVDVVARRDSTQHTKS
ncbi:MAG: hypothetical protein LPK06_04010 [Marinobacter sp.]|nr:hypothetical protein [Marinobacter sp.]